MDSEVSAILNIYREEIQAEGTIKTFQKYYPNSKLIISGSEKNSVACLAEKYSLASIITKQYINPLHEIEAKKFQVSVHDLYECINKQISNLYSLFQPIKTEFILYLHPDHRVVKKFDFKNAKYDLEILKSNRINQSVLNVATDMLPKSKLIKKYGVWGYFRTDAIIQTLSYILDNENLLKSLLSKNELFIYDDILIPILMNVLGFKIGSQNFTWELNRRTSIINKRKAYLIHHYKHIQ